MEGDHDQPAARLQHALGRRERLMQLVELFIDEDAQRLERPRRRVDLVRLGAHDPGDDVGKRLGRRDRCLLAGGDDRARDAARVALLAEDIDDVGELALGCLRDHVGGGRAALPHPHVERAAAAEREAALGLVELHRGDADIHHDAVDGIQPLRRANLRKVGEAILDQRQPAAGTVDQVEAAQDRRAVAVDADHAGVGDVEKRAAVAAGAEGGIDINAAGARREIADRLAAEHGNVTGGMDAHPPPRAGLRT